LKQTSHAQDTSRIIAPFKDTTTKKTPDTLVGKLRYPIADRRADFLSQPSINPFDIRDSSVLNRRVDYDPTTKQYYITEKLGTGYNRFPSTLSFDEFWKLKTRKDEQAYFMQRANSLGVLNRKITRPKTKVFNSYFDRLFGKTGSDLKIDIKPVGEINIRAGYQGQNVKNPTLPERARRNGGFDFDANTNFSMNASIGDKLRFPINLNSLSNLGFDNQIKLNYTGKKDEVVKFIEAGNINYISRSTLIPSTQNLFGVKTQLQFGKLFVTGVMANQKSQRQSMALQGGSSTQRFQKRLDDYEENRHFLLAQYFKENYNTVMSKLPVPNSKIQIKRIEVWVTNRNGQTTNARDVVGLADLGEPVLRKEKQQYQTNSSNQFPDNNANSLYSTIIGNQDARIPSGVAGVLGRANLRSAEDYERTFARKLTENEYFFNQQVGFLSLNIPLQADEVLAVAFQYAYNGKIYQVGEFSEGVALDPKNGVQQVLYLKLLKATSQRTDLPIWDLMMKNVYSLDLFGAIQQQDFQLNILYEEPSAGLKRYLPQVENPYYQGKSLLKILNLDTLNNRNDPQPDGVFDYVEGYTVLSSMGRIVFPLLEPFGKDLKDRVFTKNDVVNDSLVKKYVFTHLYDSIKAIAQTYANLNRFVMEGQVKGSAGGSEISLNAFNVPPGSVSVRAGGQILKEGVDYMVDYGSGTVRIINPGILSSNIPVDVSYENNLGFGFQERGFRALRIDYLASKNFNFGLSSSRLNERPFFIKTNYGSDPIKNSMYGFDFNYKKDLPGLTRLLDKLPFYSTKAKSSIVAYGEAAYLKPGHAQQIGRGESGVVYLDDFEATRTNIDLRFPFNAWTLASTPIGDDKYPRFKEGELVDSIDYNNNRARLAWYTIEPNLQDRNSANNPLANNVKAMSDSRVRQVFTNELFPQRTTNITDVQLPTFDLSYYPKERGPYNYNYKDFDANGNFKKPAEKWGGIMRALDQTDFETGIIEYVEFWVQNPFNDSTKATKGKLVLNLGNVSEDILKDGRRFYENGMPTPTSPASIDSSTWGKVPVNPIQVTNAFSNNPEDRKFQDVGFDGLGDDEERIKRAYLINQIGNGNVAEQFKKDPSADNYVWYRDASYDASNANILNRYKYFNNPQGNSALAGNSQFSSAATLLPDNEDLNRDNTLNETEAYFEYEIDLQKGRISPTTTRYVTDSKTVSVTLADGSKSVENWYLFRVPIRSPDAKKIGGIRDFKSIRFLRMYLTEFEDSVTLRFAKLDLVRNQWRQYGYEINYSNDYKQISANTNTTLNTLAVSVEENGNRTPVNYVIPPGIERIQLLSNNGVNLLQNEQALALQVKSLYNKEARGVFKTMNIDVRRYGKLSMFLHAESMIGKTKVQDGGLTAVIRIGQDFQNNFYEVRIPLKVTPPVVLSPYTNEQSNIVWPNELNVNFSDLIQLKIDRDNSRNKDSASRYFNDQKYMVFGNPNLGEVRGILIAIENTNSSSPIDAEVWMNELRLSNLDERGAWAALGRMDLVLADLGTVAVSVNNRTSGFGSIEQKMNERAKTGFTQLDIAANIDAGKLLPKQAKISLPVFAGLNKTQENPEFDPFKKDVLYADQIKNADASKRDSIKNTSIDQTTIKTLNFTNVRFMPGKNNTMLSPSNFDFSYSYSELQQTSPLIELNQVVKHRGSIGYTFNNTGKSYQPFSKLIKTKSSWLSLIKDFNFTPAPSLISYRTVFDRQFGEYTPRTINPFDGQREVAETTYDKYFTMGRIFNLRWPLTRSISFDVISNLNSRINEPAGRIDTKEEKRVLKEAVLRGGSNTLYNQQITMRYDLPTSKFPLTDWILSSYNVSSNYNWIGASRLFTNLGNTIENILSHQVNAQFNFNSFYNKSKFIRSALSDAKPTPNQSNPLTNQLVIKKEDALNGLTGKARDSAYKKWKEARKQERIAMRALKANEVLNIPGPVKTLVSLLTMVQNASLDYAENYNSRLPGFKPGVQFIDRELKGITPAFEYSMIGKKLDSNWLNTQERNGNLTTDANFNLLFRQGFEQRLSARVMLEPIKTFIIDLKLEKTFTKEYSEFFKDTSTSGNGYRTHNNPLSAGGFSISYVALRTFFDRHDPNMISKQFENFQKYRITISEKVAGLNKYWLKSDDQYDKEGYAKGYGKYAQDVLIPSFIAAYTGKEPGKVNLLNQNNSSIRSNPFSGMLPMPNWNLLYNGLAAIPGISNVFSNISLTHGYNGNLSMNSFSSSLLYVDSSRYGAPSFLDPVSKNFVPYFLIPNVTISERMEPLIGLNVTTISQWSIRFEYKKSRILALSLVDYQLSENNSTEWVIGTSFRKRGLKLPFNIPGLNNNKLANDLTFRLDVAVRDVFNTNSRLDQSNAYGTGGQKEITLQPSVDYVLNSKINLRFFFDQRRATPYISSAPPITNTRAGVNIRIAL
jgi:cell surface protein SprA